MSLLIPKRTMEARPENFGVCLWRFPSGSYLQDEDGNYFSAQGRPFDNSIEKKLAEAVRSLYGDTIDGKPFWLPGFRKITDMEWDDQMDSLLSGSIPDPVDIVRGIDG